MKYKKTISLFIKYWWLNGGKDRVDCSIVKKKGTNNWREKLIDTEELFQLLAKKNWDSLSEVLFKHKNLIQKNPYISQVTALFESEFFDHIASLSVSEKLAKMRHISLIIESNRDSFSKSFVDRAIDEKLQALKDIGDKGLASYASTYFDRPLAQQLLQAMRRESPEQLAEARRSATKIEAVSTRQTTAKTIKLFKSGQEENFYLALQDEFSHYLAYPNVAMSCIIDINAIRHKLTLSEKDYFFKAIVDFVLFDPKADYEPIHFFELDSKYHDSENAKRNDGMKNAIFQAADIKLTRIRAFEPGEATRSSFRDMLLDLVAES